MSSSIPKSRWKCGLRVATACGSLAIELFAQSGSAATGSLLSGEIPQTTVVYLSPAEPGWRITKGPGHNRLPELLRWDKPPLLPNPVLPVYPYEKLVAGESGEVVVRFIVDSAGRVSEREVLTATSPEFAESVGALLDALGFVPARRQGSPCYAVVQSRFSFDTHPNRPAEQVGSGSQKSQLVRHDFGGTRLLNPYFADRRLWHELQSGETAVCPTGQLDEAPRLVARTPPAYPPAMARLGREGEAEVEIVVDRRGRARLPRALSATDPAFGHAAVQAAAQWEFKPAMSRGKPVVVRLRVPVEFRLPAAAKN